MVRTVTAVGGGLPGCPGAEQEAWRSGYVCGALKQATGSAQGGPGVRPSEGGSSRV